MYERVFGLSKLRQTPQASIFFVPFDVKWVLIPIQEAILASQAELIEQLQAMNKATLLNRLASTEGRDQLRKLDYDAGANCKVIAAAIAAVPAVDLASREDLQEIFDDLLRTRHPDVLAAISDKITEFDIDQTNANPWLREWAVDQQYGRGRSSIHNSDDAFKQIGDHIREVNIRTQARAFFGKDIEGVSQQDFRTAISEMNPTALLEKLSDPQGREELYNLNSWQTQEYDLVGFAITSVPADQLSAHPDLEKTLKALLTERGKHKNTLTAVADKLTEFTVEQTNAHPWIRDITTDKSIRDIYGAEEQLSKIGKHLNDVKAFNTAETFVGKPVVGISSTDFTEAVMAMDPKDILAGLMDPEKLRALEQMGAHSNDSGQLVALAITQVPPEMWPAGPELTETLGALMHFKNPNTLAAIVDRIERLPDATLLAQDDKSSKYHNRLVEWGFSHDVSSASNATTSHNPIVEIVQRVTGAARDRANQDSFFGNGSTPPAPTLGDR